MLKKETETLKNCANRVRVSEGEKRKNHQHKIQRQQALMFLMLGAKNRN